MASEAKRAVKRVRQEAKSALTSLMSDADHNCWLRPVAGYDANVGRCVCVCVRAMRHGFLGLCGVVW